MAAIGAQTITIAIGAGCSFPATTDVFIGDTVTFKARGSTRRLSRQRRKLTIFPRARRPARAQNNDAANALAVRIKSLSGVVLSGFGLAAGASNNLNTGTTPGLQGGASYGLECSPATGAVAKLNIGTDGPATRSGTHAARRGAAGRPDGRC